eukprot:CAMPEP_0119067470 /NCGR_PEP_ID=MMETSP1178-20130426/9849_1 /TAXON_ID=33656 /ORGANISM="unid sp, Strain CCMP2000" /LENGTH=49 /DNA_ID=CAMNT_0007049129 /DNA_START=157 /DNA_END=306 /DNA_ORIENTATION=+
MKSKVESKISQNESCGSKLSKSIMDCMPESFKAWIAKEKAKRAAASRLG